MNDDEWSQRFKAIMDEAAKVTRQRMELAADMLASEQRIDEMERNTEAITDPVQREQERRFVQQAHLNNNFNVIANQQAERIDQMGQAIIVLADAVRSLEQEVRELREGG